MGAHEIVGEGMKQWHAAQVRYWDHLNKLLAFFEVRTAPRPTVGR